MEGDELVKEAYMEYQEEQGQSSDVKVAVTSLTVGNIRVIFGVVILFYYLAFVKKSIDAPTFYWLMVGVIVFVYIIAYKARSEGALIPEHKLKAILFNKLKWKQVHSPDEIPQGKIEMNLPCKLKKIEGVPVKYVFYFKIVQSTGLETAYTAEMNPKNGYVIGFESRLEGFTGREVTDVAFIRRKEDIWEQKYFKGGKKPQQP